MLTYRNRRWLVQRQMKKTKQIESNARWNKISKIKYNDEIGKWNKIKTLTKRKTSNVKWFDSLPKVLGICFPFIFMLIGIVSRWWQPRNVHGIVASFLWFVSLSLCVGFSFLAALMLESACWAKAACAMRYSVVFSYFETQIPLPILRAPRHTNGITRFKHSSVLMPANICYSLATKQWRVSSFRNVTQNDDIWQWIWNLTCFHILATVGCLRLLIRRCNLRQLSSTTSLFVFIVGFNKHCLSNA